MRCLACGVLVEELWRWCPDCGGEVTPHSTPIDLRSVPTDGFAVEWIAEDWTPTVTLSTGPELVSL
jgi:hypothetical protein